MTDLVGREAIIVGDSPHPGENVIIRKVVGDIVTVTPKNPHCFTFAEADLPVLPSNDSSR